MAAPYDVIRWNSYVRTSLVRLGYVGAIFERVLPPKLILGMIWQESSGIQGAWNPEPRYRWYMNVRTWTRFRSVTDAEILSEIPPLDFPFLAGDRDQEWWAQQASWGLMQIMGSAAREQGFKGSYIPAIIIDPVVSISLGVKHFWRYAMKNGMTSVEEGLLRYNGGGNQKYDDEVLAKAEEVGKALSLV